MWLTLPGLGNPAGTPETRAAARANRRGTSTAPPAPATPLDPEILKAREALRKKQAQASGRESTVLTSPSGVLGDPPLDRPVARSATMLGG